MSAPHGVPVGMPEQGDTLFHMLPAADWMRAIAEQQYAPASLAGEGFIHLSPSPEVALQVANHLYATEQGEWVVLLLDTESIAAPVQWDPVDATFFPHIYGPLNLDAVREVVPFPRDESGLFLPF